MKKKAQLIITFFLLFSVVKAAYFEKLPYTIVQPDGTEIGCFVSGDEFFNWIHDDDGYTYIQAPNGYYYYAEKDGDHIKPSAYKVKSVDPSAVGLKKWVKISEKEYQHIRNDMFSYETKNNNIPTRAPHSGGLNNLVMYIRFSDDAEFSTTRQVYDDKFNPVTGNTLKSYYKEVSYNNLIINSTHYPFCEFTTNLSYQDTHSRNYFQPYNATTNPIGYTGGANGTERTSREHQLLVDAVNWINNNSPVSNSLNLDGDGDNKVDNVCFIIKGSSGGWNDLLWAHRWALFSQTININGKRVFDYTFQPENQVSVRTLCHEMFHALGAPDLYHYTNQGVITPVGSWDLMESGSGHMSAYMKWKYTNHSWISTIPEITTSGTYTLHPLSSSTNNSYKIASPYALNEYFVVEYRNKAGIFESNIPGSGLLVYRIDSGVSGNSNGPPDEIYLYRPDGTVTTNGNTYNAFFSSTVGRTSINDTTNPRCFLQNGGIGGLNISNVSSADTTISFNVNFPLPCSQPALQATSYTSNSVTNSSMTIGWTRGSGSSVLIIGRAGSAVNIIPVSGNTYSANAVFGQGTQIGTGNYVVYKGTGTSVNLTALIDGTTYFYDIYEYNSPDYCYKKPALSGSTTTAGYCAAGSTTTLSYGEYISNVTLGSINQSSVRGNGGYQDFSNLITTMQIGMNYTATINCTNSYEADQVLIWADWNHDGDFTDTGENIYSSSGSFVNPHITANFTPPVGAYIGTTRLRIRLDDSGNGPNPFPCGNAVWGDVEDYSVNIIPKNSTFTAAVSNAWEISANWDHSLPDSSTNVTIPANKLAIVNSVNNYCNNLIISPLGKLTINPSKALLAKGIITLESDSSGKASLINNGMLTASSNTVNCFIDNPDEFHILSSAVSAQSISPDFNQLNGFYLWNEALANWIEFANQTDFSASNNGNNFIPGKAYAASFPSITTKSFSGNLNNGIINVPLTVTQGAYSGWNLIGNPYPSAINWNTSTGFDRGMLDNAASNNAAIWIWNPNVGNYGSFISNGTAGTNGVSNYIASSQGFWVKAASAGIFKFNNNALEHASQTWLKSSSIENSIDLKVICDENSFSDEIIVNFGYTNDLGGAEKKFSINPSAPGLYSVKMNKYYSINNLTTTDQHNILPIGFKPGINGNYRIQAGNTNSFSTPTYIYLKDLFTNTVIDLHQIQNYTFTATINDNADRFQLLFESTPLAVSTNYIQDIYIYSNNKNIYLNCNEKILEIFIYNMLGQIIKKNECSNESVSIDMKGNTTGCYIAKVISSNKVYTKKIIVK
jgi:M6 family metalloprotease-like protein